MTEHEDYKILCALAASGKASPEDLEQLNSHLRDCADCRTRLADFAQLSAQNLLPYCKGHNRKHLPEGLRARFAERAQGEGIPLHGLARGSPRFWWAASPQPVSLWTGGIVVAAIVALAGILALRGIQGSGTAAGARSTSPAPPIAATRTAPSIPLPMPAVDAGRETAELRAQLSSARQEIAQLRQRAGILNDEIAEVKKGQAQQQIQQPQPSSAVPAEVASRLLALETENASLRLQNAGKDLRLKGLEHQLEQKGSASAETMAAIGEKQAEVDRLRERLNRLEDAAEREHRLQAASAQARDLITARNLHIIDVHDNDRSGRERPFGRIFYTEGQALIFYAYDLSTATGRDTKVSFHVWGGTLAGQQQARSLGIFRSEDTAAGRWVLTCDDPHVLAQINTVFVTLEAASTKEVDQPRGKRILYAFLGDRPNHP